MFENEINIDNRELRRKDMDILKRNNPEVFTEI